MPRGTDAQPDTRRVGDNGLLAPAEGARVRNQVPNSERRRIPSTGRDADVGTLHDSESPGFRPELANVNAAARQSTL
jgi:hypothetical protein